MRVNSSRRPLRNAASAWAFSMRLLHRSRNYPETIPSASTPKVNYPTTTPVLGPIPIFDAASSANRLISAHPSPWGKP